MKSTPAILITSLLAAGLALQMPIRADDQEGDEHHERGGSDVSGTEHLEQKILLTATVDAPAGAKGKAELEAEDHQGISAAELKLEVEGLADGIYTVTVTSLADAAPTVLGTFELVPATTGGGDHDDHDEDDDSEDESHDGDSHRRSASTTHHDDNDESESEIVFGGEHGIAFPDGFNPLDIGGISIADADGVVILQGSFADLASLQLSNFAAAVPVEPGVAAVAATGTVTIRAKVVRKSLSQRFALAAHNLPKSADLTLTFNNAQTAKVRTNRKGNLAVSRLPKGVIGHRILTIKVDDASGQRVLNAHF